MTTNPLHKQAEEMLAGIAETKAAISELTAEYEQKVREVQAPYAKKLAELEQDLADRDSLLKDYMKWNKARLFDADDIVYLRGGQLLFAVVRKIAFPRNRDALIALLEKLGFTDAVKTPKKTCDTDVIEKWDDDKLAQAGLKRKSPEDTFNYSLQEKADAET